MENIKGIQSQVAGQVTEGIKGNNTAGDFSKALKDAIEKVDALQKEADNAIQEFSAGKITLHQTMIAMEKANLSFQLMIQVKNKIVSAYEEVMRTQV